MLARGQDGWRVGFLATLLPFAMATANPGDEGEHHGKTKRDGERYSSRERERRSRSSPCWKFFFFFFPGNAVAKLADWGTPTAPVLLPSVRLALSLSTVCDAFRAPRLVIRVIYAALIAPRWTITAVDCQGRQSFPPAILASYFIDGGRQVAWTRERSTFLRWVSSWQRSVSTKGRRTANYDEYVGNLIWILRLSASFVFAMCTYVRHCCCPL